MKELDAMVIYISEPVKKEKNFISKITNETNKLVRIKVSDASFMSISPLTGGGKTMRIYINDDDIVTKITNIDDEVRKITIKKNQEWFNNNLTSETINSLFRNSVNKVNNTMLVLISDTNEPIIYLNGVQDEEFNINTLQPKTSFTLVMEAQGLLIYPKKFGIRWIIRSVYISNNTDETHENIHVDKESIEESWKNDIYEMESKIETDISVLESRIQSLKILKNDINTYYENAIKESTITPLWHESFNCITRKYMLYSNGSV